MNFNSQLVRHNRSWWNSKMIQCSIRRYSCTFVSRSHFLCFQSTGAQGRLINIHIQSWREGAKRREPSGGRTRGNGHKLKCRRFSEHQETLCQLWEWPNSGKGCPERRQSIHHCKYAKVWTWSCRTGSGCYCLKMGFGLGDLQRSLQTSVLLWFWGSVPLIYSYFSLPQNRATLISFYIILKYRISAIST